MALCQARSDTNGDGQVSLGFDVQGTFTGDDVALFLVRKPGAGERIDALLGHDPAGRFLVLQSGDRVTLVDSWQQSPDVSLDERGFDARALSGPDRQHRSVSFDHDGKQLAYLRRAKGKQQVVLRSLHNGQERTLDPGPGEVVRVELDPTGHWLVLHLLIDDTSENGRLDWPVPFREKPWHGCHGPVPRYDLWPDRGDRVSQKVARTSNLKLQTWRDLVYPLGDALLLRKPGGALLWRRGTQKVELSPEACSAVVHFADAKRGLLLAGCGKDPGRQPMSLVGANVSQALNFDLAQRKLDSPPIVAPRLLPVYPGSATSLLDLDRRQLIPLQVGDLVLHTHDMQALLQRGSRLWRFDATSNEREELNLKTDRNSLLLRQGRFAFISPVLVDLGEKAPPRRLDRRPLALGSGGRLLVPTQSGEPDRAPQGPFSWAPAPAEKPDPSPSEAP